TEIVRQRRLPGIFIAIEPPFAGDIRGPGPAALGREAKVDDGRGGNHQHHTNGSHRSPSRHSTFAIRWTHKCADYAVQRAACRPTPDEAFSSLRQSSRTTRGGAE